MDWASALAVLGCEELDPVTVEQTLGSVLKYREDFDTVRDDTIVELVREARAVAAAAGAVSEALTLQVVTFGRVLREAGIEVGAGRLADALRGLDRVDLTRQDDVYWTLRTTLVARREELEPFDRAFRAWFLRAPGRRRRPAARTRGACRAARSGCAATRARAPTPRPPRASRTASARARTRSCGARTSAR